MKKVFEKIVQPYHPRTDCENPKFNKTLPLSYLNLEQ